MAKTSAEVIVGTLIRSGVKRVYGLPGDSLNGITDSIRKHGEIQWVHVRHEETAAFAAGAEAHLTGELAVCAGSCGPGNLHLINGLYDCNRSRVPVLALAAQVPSSELGTQYFQETRPEILFRDCSHFCELVGEANNVPRLLGIAMRTAQGAASPCWSCRAMCSSGPAQCRCELWISRNLNLPSSPPPHNWPKQHLY